MKIKKSVSVILALCLLLSFAVLSPVEDVSVKAGAALNSSGGTRNSAVFILDPGHGGSDPGACALGRREAADVLDLSLRVARLIDASGSSCALTRTTDVTHSLATKVSIANSGSFTYFLSIHRNAGGGRGIETYYCSGLSSSSSDARLATSVQNKLIGTGLWTNRGVKTAAFYVIAYTNMAAALVEVGFIDTASDNTVFANNMDTNATAIANGLLAMVGKSVNTDKTAPTISNATITNKTATGYRVSCTVSDNVKVTQVKFPTWTETGGQDDIVWHVGTISGSTAYYDVKISEHGNSKDIYHTHIYAYDAAGNSSHSDPGSVDLRVTNKLNGNSPIDIGNGVYIKLKDLGSGRYLTCNTADSNVYAADKNDSNNQVWICYNMGSNQYKIVNLGDGKTLDVNGASTENGANLQTYNDNGTEAQRFYIYNIDGAYFFRPIYVQAHVIDIYLGGTNAQIYQANYGTNQQFSMERVDVEGGLPLNFGNFTAIIKVPDLNKYVATDGDNVMATEQGDVFNFTRNSDGTYTIAASDGKVIDVASGIYENGTNLQLWSSNGTDAQKFYLCYANGRHYLKSVVGNFVVDVDSNTLNAQLYTYNQSVVFAQGFEIIPETSENHDMLPITAINASQYESSSQVWTTGTFTSLYWGVLVLEAKGDGYVVKAKYNSGDVKSVTASTANPIIAVHAGMADAYAAFLTTEVGAEVSLQGVSFASNALLFNAHLRMPYSFVLVDASPYKLDDKYVTINGAGAAASVLGAEFKCTVVVTDGNGTLLPDNAIVGTGCVVQQRNSAGTVIESATVVVVGDITGDGIITAVDSINSKLAIKSVAALSEAATKAADVNGDGTLSSTDYVEILTICKAKT